MKRLTTLLLVAVFSCVNNYAAEVLASVCIEKVPHVQQKPDFCGEACAEMCLKKLGYSVSQDDVFNVSGLSPIHGRGCHTTELDSALRAIGFETGVIWTNVPADSVLALQAEWSKLHASLLMGIPSIICMRTSATPDATEHFRLILGYDAAKNEIIYHEPAEKDAAYRRMKLDVFLDLWPLKYDAKRWTVIRMELKAGKIKVPKREEGFTDADYAQHIMKLKEKIPSKAFTMVLQKPFVVVGDESAALVALRAEQTVKWATSRLKKMYYKKDPENIIDIWLFKDKASYEKYTWEIFSDKPDTPYGYSSSEHNALIMNIGTGGGTLVHEIVHPFMDTNFPECPSWFNEGMGSLYEQSQGKGDEIIGLTNWRLPGLQEAIQKGEVPSFKELTSTTTHEFYNKDRGTNYAQARYLCYYLQEKGLLTKFYHAFYAARVEDPTGYKTLQTVLGKKDMDAFKKEWEAYVLKLRFGR
jgi:Papain-like cysteine protease AvrRpt2